MKQINHQYDVTLGETVITLRFVDKETKDHHIKQEREATREQLNNHWKSVTKKDRIAAKMALSKKQLDFAASCGYAPITKRSTIWMKSAAPMETPPPAIA